MTGSLLETSPYAAGVVAVREHPAVERLRDLLEELAAITGDPAHAGPLADTHRIDQIEALERVKAACAAAQARWRWRGAAPPPRGPGISASRRRWPRCPTPSRC